MSTSPIVRLHEHLEDEGLPVVSVTAAGVQLDNPTPAQTQQADDAHANWDWRPRRPKPIQTLIDAQDQMALLWTPFVKRILARLLQIFPDLDLEAGGSLEGDEPYDE